MFYNNLLQNIIKSFLIYIFSYITNYISIKIFIIVQSIAHKSWWHDKYLIVLREKNFIFYVYLGIYYKHMMLLTIFGLVLIYYGKIVRKILFPMCYRINWRN